MLIALLGDIHIGARNDNLAFHNAFAKFYDKVFFSYLNEHNIRHVIQLGDIFDRRKYINFDTLHQSRQYFFERLNKDYTSWMLVGNHDTYYKNTNVVNSPSMLLQNYHNITVVNTPTHVDFESVKFLMVPWICDENREKVYEVLERSTANVVVGHFEFDGFEMYRGIPHHGTIQSNIVKNFEMVLSGHFHHRSTSGNVTYVGTPYEMSWSDYDDPKGFHVYNTDTRQLTFIENPYRMFYKIHYDDEGKQIPEVLNIPFEKYSNAYVKVIVRNKTNPYCFDMLIDKLEKAGVLGVQVVDDHFHMDSTNDSDIVSEAEDTRKILLQYAGQVGNIVDKKQLEDLMVSLYEEALSVE